jgi:DNA-binding MurR/RpiR family transcriptional regulator
MIFFQQDDIETIASETDSAVEGAAQTIADRVQAAFDDFTRAERQAVNALMRNYPVSGLGSVTALAQAAEVSTPTIVRLVQKIGFRGYPDFQAALRAELEEQLSSPLAKHDRWAGSAPETHILNRFADAAMENMRRTLAQIDPVEFDAACDMLAGPERRIFAVGGRITHALADYFCTHMQVIRDRVVGLPANTNSWAHSLISMRPGDALVVFDIRRYENDLLKLTEIAAGRGVRVILFTDQWGSPIAPHAVHRFNCRIEVPSAWDSSAAIMVVLETLIAGVQQRTWASTSARMTDLESLYDQLRLFRKFR